MGFQHRFSEPLMVDISHNFCFLFCVIVVIHNHSKLNQKRTLNDVMLRRFGSSFKNCYSSNSVNFAKDLGQSPIQSAQILTACG